MGDPLHAKPVLVTYGGTEANPDITLYMTTNDGYLHAIDIDDGHERFAFVPPAMLPNLKTIYVNSGSDPKSYGLDGSITAWVKDHNGNGIIETPDGDGNNDHVYLYFGQRRGGTHYYAIDVSDRAKPKYLWSITGGAGDFHELAQTWSAPRHTRIKLYNAGTSKLEPRDVVIFAGGYDTDQDTSATARTADDTGRAVYMVDAKTGALVWWAGSSNIAVAASPQPNLKLTGMDYSIPSDVRIIDVNGDHIADRLYVGDMGGQLWRLDIDNKNNTGTTNLVTAARMADLQKTGPSATPDASHNRRFYYPPDVALMIPPGEDSYLSIAIGSGYRAHPLNTTVQDRFYMVKDPNPFGPPADGNDADSDPDYPATIVESDLFDATTNPSDLTGLKTAKGWLVKLTDFSADASKTGSFVGEKVLARATTFGSKVMFTTFTPVASASANACAPSQGTAKVHAMNVHDARPAFDLDTVDQTTTTLQRKDRSFTLVRGGLPPEVTVLFPPDTQPVGLVAAERLPIPFTNIPVKTYWYPEETD